MIFLLTKVSDAEKSFREWYRIIFLIAIVISVIFLVIFSMLGLRVNSDMACGIDKIGAHTSAVYDNRSELDNAGDYVLQEFALNITDTYIKHEFCFTTFCVDPDGCHIQVINQDQAVLMNKYDTYGQNRNCGIIKNITDHQYLGLLCPTCNTSASELKIQEVVAGDLVNVVDNNSSSLEITKDEQLTFTLYSYKNCKGLIKFFLWCYIFVMGSLFLLVSILLGFRRFEKFIFEELDQ